MGLDIAVEPFIKITYEYDLVELHECDAWAFTSANAANYISTHFDDIDKRLIPEKVFAISPRSTEIIQQLNLQFQYAGTDAKSLAEHILTTDMERIAFFKGNLTQDTFTDILTAGGIKVAEHQVYQTKILHKVVNMNAFEGIAFASPSAVQGFAQLNRITDQEVFVIGNTTKAAAERLLDVKPIVAAEPSIDDLLKTIYYYYKA